MYFLIQENNDFLSLYHSDRNTPFLSSKLTFVGRLISGVLYVLTGLMMLFYNVSVGGPINVLACLICIAFGVYAMLGRVFGTWAKCLHFKQPDGTVRKTRYEFGDKITIRMGNTVMTYDYSDFGKLTENEQFFYLYENKGFAHVLCKADFIEGDALQFAAFITPRLGQLKPAVVNGGVVFRIIFEIASLALSLYVFFLWLDVLILYFM